MSISLIITTSPGREENLGNCLLQLQNQSIQDFEVIVVDDGSEFGRNIAQKYNKNLNLTYLGRANDMNVCRSRNLGVEQARYQQLVFLDSDILLNPQALANYATHFKSEPETVWAGYFGYVGDFVSLSAFVPGRQINYLDRRFLVYAYQAIQPSPSVLTEPGRMFWSGNIGLKREIYESVQGFDEQFVGWGGEDQDFAFRVLRAGKHIHFSLNVWGEHQIHSYDEPFHRFFEDPTSSAKRFESEHNHPELNYQVKVSFEPAQVEALCTKILRFYVQHDSNVPADFKAHFLNPLVRLMIRAGEQDRWQMAYALPKAK